MKDEKVYLLTDLCMWEANKRNKTFYPHAIEVVDEKTGAVHYIKSGSRIIFVDGSISPRASQKDYNKAAEKKDSKVSADRQARKNGKGSKKSRQTNKHESL